MHIRVGDRDEGRTLFVHEIQSDWAQENRSGQIHHVTHNLERIRKLDEVHIEESDKSWNIVDNKTGDILDKWYKEFVPNRPTDDMVLSALETTAGANHNHPFQDNWQTVAVKRILRYAAENGYSRIEFARGEDTLNIDGMGLEKGSTNELGRLNSYNGSISFRETKKGQPGDYKIIQADKVGEYTRYSVKFNDDIVIGNENNTYDFFVSYS